MVGILELPAAKSSLGKRLDRRSEFRHQPSRGRVGNQTNARWLLFGPARPSADVVCQAIKVLSDEPHVVHAFVRCPLREWLADRLFDVVHEVNKRLKQMNRSDGIKASVNPVYGYSALGASSERAVDRGTPVAYSAFSVLGLISRLGSPKFANT